VDADGESRRPLLPQHGAAAQERLDVDPVRRHAVDDVPEADALAALVATNPLVGIAGCGEGVSRYAATAAQRAAAGVDMGPWTLCAHDCTSSDASTGNPSAAATCSQHHRLNCRLRTTVGCGNLPSRTQA